MASETQAFRTPTSHIPLPELKHMKHLRGSNCKLKPKNSNQMQRFCWVLLCKLSLLFLCSLIAWSRNYFSFFTPSFLRLQNLPFESHFFCMDVYRGTMVELQKIMMWLWTMNLAMQRNCVKLPVLQDSARLLQFCSCQSGGPLSFSQESHACKFTLRTQLPEHCPSKGNPLGVPCSLYPGPEPGQDK